MKTKKNVESVDIFVLHRQGQKILQDARIEAHVEGDQKRGEELSEMMNQNEIDFRNSDKAKLKCPNCDLKTNMLVSISGLALCLRCKTPFCRPPKEA